MARNIGGVVAGVILAILVIMAVEFVGHQAFPRPALDLANTDASRAALAGAPLTALLVPLIAWFLGALVGGYAGNRVALATWPGWVVTGFVLLGAVANFWMIPHPSWMIAAGIALPILAGWLASRTVRSASIHEG